MILVAVSCRIVKKVVIHLTKKLVSKLKLTPSMVTNSIDPLYSWRANIAEGLRRVALRTDTWLAYAHYILQGCESDLKLLWEGVLN
jgi:hypothetical protein